MLPMDAETSSPVLPRSGLRLSVKHMYPGRTDSQDKSMAIVATLERMLAVETHYGQALMNEPN